ncbi:PepSY domain-containing protein [Roseiconus nitratireducens]|uniref:PepSY domain-containing protein n=1 Tax=Roseiconus nitratireducens TaxID=2605748 RepID=A0A5M6D011_9BACT|nr:PepSY-associated TM helix domain-containing protein [Roseiconus nitratireducens]KAA5538879.1 PepSY domain-containing protein [Roseiconus nitratireducens]
MRQTLRKRWLAVHRWLGLTVGLLLVLIGLTGSLLVFDHAIDERLNPDLLLTNGSGDRQPIAEIIAAAEEAFSGSAERALSVSRPRIANGVWTVWFRAGTEDNPKFVAVHIDPYTAHVTGQRTWGEDLMSLIYRLHFRLLAGAPGAVLVGMVGIIAMISIASGIVLWWPLWKNGWRAGFAVRKGARFNFDLHKTTGILSAVFLMVIAFTGVYMEFHEWFHAAVSTFAEVSEPADDFTSTTPKTATRLTPDQAVTIAQPIFPKATFDHLHPPTGPEGFYEVAFRQSGETQKSFGRSQVFLDQYSGEVLAIRSPQDFTAADAFFAWQFPLHNGEAFGLFGRWVVFLMGITPALFYITGLLLWWRRGKARRRKTRLKVGSESTVLPARRKNHPVPEPVGADFES